jgi:hypothetical protein
MWGWYVLIPPTRAGLIHGGCSLLGPLVSLGRSCIRIATPQRQDGPSLCMGTDWKLF